MCIIRSHLACREILDIFTGTVYHCHYLYSTALLNDTSSNFSGFFQRPLQLRELIRDFH